MLLEALILLLSAIFIFNWWAHGYWKRKNVISPPTEFLFGNTRKLILRQTVMSIMFNEFYEKYKPHKIIGFYCFHKPMMFATDPEIIRNILVTDFNSFSDNGFELSKEVDPILGFNPFTAKTVPVWKELRSIQATNQTPLKLKETVPNLAKISEFMYDFISKQKCQPVLLSDLTTRAAVDSAVMNAYGIEPKSFTDPEFGFMKHATGEKVFVTSNINILAALFIPVLNKLYPFRITSKEAEEFFKSMTKTNIEHRQSSNVTRGDLIDTIIKLNKKKLEQNNKAYSDVELSAHCAAFYLDATITAAMTLTFCLLELANHPDVQEKLRNEIFSVEKKPEDFDFEKINSIAYLQMVIDETLRLHPPVAILSRLCTKDTVIADTKISKGTKVFISPVALHYDPEYFPDPTKFDPERFSEINKESMTKYSYMPFGEGPRICVGMKYGTIFVKSMIAFILLKYRILPCGNQNTVLHDFESFLLIAKPDAAVKFEEL